MHKKVLEIKEEALVSGDEKISEKEHDTTSVHILNSGENISEKQQVEENVIYCYIASVNESKPFKCSICYHTFS